MKLQSKIFNYFREREKQGKFLFVLRGGRRSGKTYAVCQRVLLLCNNTAGTIVNVASMTAEQGRLGAFADFVNIINAEPYFLRVTRKMETPREIRFLNGSKIFFKSYQDSETAKGIACDYLYLNEANNFSKQQYTDLSANVRKGIFVDYNPNFKFWIDDYVEEDEICVTTWQDNRKHLTPVQLAYFDDLKKQAEREGASDLDIRNYRVYYLGEYYELRGDIFNASNICVVDIESKQKNKLVIFCDPSALRGADFFALCLMCENENGEKEVLETWSENTGDPQDVIELIIGWQCKYGNANVFVETNGIIGQKFYEDCIKKGIEVQSYYSHDNKFERIVANYGALTKEVVFVRRYNTDKFLSQIYEFGKKCEHDDNIDCVNSAYNVYKFI